MKGRALLCLALVMAGAFGACSTRSPAHVTVSQLVRGERPPEGSDDHVAGAPIGSVVVRATVTDVRSTPVLLVELSDPRQEEHIWVFGFETEPGRGEEVWTAIVSGPVADDLVGVAYPTAGLLPTPKDRTYVTPRGALALLLGAVAAIALVTLVVASAMTRHERVRKCSGCAGPVDADWLTCPRCGHPLVAPPSPPAELIPAPGSPEALGSAPKADPPHGSGAEASAPTVLLRDNGEV